jgi:multicomponent K+:H+ antiporter subunit A
MSLLLIVFLPLLGALLPAWFIRWGRNQSALAAGGVAGTSFLLLLSLIPSVFSGNTPEISIPWMSSLGLNLALKADGLGFLFSLLILGIGLLVILYARFYLSEKDPMGRFYAFLLLFMGAMLGVVLSDNILLLLIFWELTSLTSFLLIGYWKHLPEGRQGARMALVVTGGGGLAMLAGFLLLGNITGTYDLSAILTMGDQIRAHDLYGPMLVLVLLGAFTKSAQFPFHFWLPHAMAAPTPVSSYLHSATMVKAGVFLLARLFPALSGTPLWFYLVTGAGVATLLFAGYVALLKHDLKGLLAYSTVSHLGLITTLFGLGTKSAAVVGVFHIMNHAAFKASLFMGAGIVDHETGTRDIRRLSGLWKTMPFTGALMLIASASMAGIPPLNGFLSKEMFLEQTLEAEYLHNLPWLLPSIVTFALIFSVAYSIRLVYSVFFGHESHDLPKHPHEPPHGMRLPVEILVALCILIGLFPKFIAGPLLAVAAGATVGGELPYYSLSLWHGLNLPLLMSVIAVVGGILIYRIRWNFINLHEKSLPLPQAKALFDATVDRLTRASRALTEGMENGSLQRYLALMVGVAALALGVPFLLSPWSTGPGGLTPVDGVSVVAWVLLLFAAIGTAALHQQRLKALIVISVVGLVVSLAFVHLSAPDLALTQLSVEVVTIVLLLLALHLLPKEGPSEDSAGRKIRDIVLAVAAGGAVSVVAWVLLTTPISTISDFHLAQSYPGGGGNNVVNVILVDFRGFDTFGEVTVLAIAGLGIYALIDGMGIPDQWRIGDADDEKRYPLLLTIITRLLLPLALVVSIYLFLRGHNQPGGGFIAGLVTAVALILQYIASGIGWTTRRFVRDFHGAIALGVLTAGLTGMGSWFFNVPFLTSWYDYFELPVIGRFPLASAALFDLGVYVTVVAGVLLMLVNMGKIRNASAASSSASGEG